MISDPIKIRFGFIETWLCVVIADEIVWKKSIILQFLIWHRKVIVKIAAL